MYITLIFFSLSQIITHRVDRHVINEFNYNRNDLIFALLKLKQNRDKTRIHVNSNYYQIVDNYFFWTEAFLSESRETIVWNNIIGTIERLRER